MKKSNFQAELEVILEEIKKNNVKPSLLLHSCCGPCSSYCLSYLEKYFKITVLYYNPNIYPESEYEHRLSEQKRLICEMNREAEAAFGEAVGTPGEIALMTLPYVHSEFTDFVTGLENEKEGGARCEKCFELRLSKTAELAAKNGFDYFATTLSVSPHKNAMILDRVGRAAGENVKENTSWLPSDFKKKEGYKQSIELSKKYNLYRQNYCGCEFSIWWEEK